MIPITNFEISGIVPYIHALIPAFFLVHFMPIFGFFGLSILLYKAHVVTQLTEISTFYFALRKFKKLEKCKLRNFHLVAYSNMPAAGAAN